MYHGIKGIDQIDRHKGPGELAGFFDNVVSAFSARQNGAKVVQFVPKPTPRGGQGIQPKGWQPKRGWGGVRDYEQKYALFGLGDMDAYGDIVDSSGLYEGQTESAFQTGASSPITASPSYGVKASSGGWFDNLLSSVGGAASKIITGKANTAVALNNASNVRALQGAGYNVGLPGAVPTGLLVAGAVGLAAFLLLKK